MAAESVRFLTAPGAVLTDTVLIDKFQAERSRQRPDGIQTESTQTGSRHLGPGKRGPDRYQAESIHATDRQGPDTQGTNR